MTDFSDHDAREKARQLYLKHPVKTKEDLDDLIVDMMCELGYKHKCEPDGQCDGHEIITDVMWNLMKK